MDEKIKIKVFLASPMDLEKERAQFQKVLQLVNEKEGASQNAEFSLLCWENDTRPGLNEDAQAVVNRQLRGDYDVFVCMFKERVGTPTNRTISGTVEEYERARIKALKNPDLEIMPYFFSSENAGQDIQALKSKIGNDGALYWEVRNAEDFETQVYGHLKQILSSHLERLERKNQKAAAIEEQNAASVALIFESSVLLVQRSSNSRHGPETWQLPGGKSEVGETPEQTAIREIKEELSYTIKSPEQLIKLKTFRANTPSHPDTILNMTLFIYKVNKKFKPKLNKESKSYEWVPLSCCDFERKNLFQLNDQMLKAVWREVYLTSTLKALLGSIRDSESSLLPTALSGVSENELNTAYAMLSLLGITDSNRGMVLKSERYGKKLLEELVSLLSDGDSIFKDDKKFLPDSNTNFSYEAVEQLKDIRANAFCSNDSLITHLSCDTMIDHSVRRVCDVLLFGEFEQKKYLLLRWDFFAGKYQLIGKGLEKVAITEEDDKVDAVLSSRLPSFRRYFDHVFITKYEGYHFSAGSVDNDPIWRKYLIDMAVLLPNNRADTADIFKTVSSINKETEAKIENSIAIDPASAKTLKYFVWCELDELMENPTSYRGNRVSGFGDMKGNMGEKKLHSLTENLLTSLELPCDPQNDDNLEKYKKIFEKKYVSG